jgi:lactoylglutathione lyase
MHSRFSFFPFFLDSHHRPWEHIHYNLLSVTIYAKPCGTVLSMYLYETHLAVRNTAASQKFYQDVVGLEFAYRDPTRNIVFLWIGPDKQSMLGLWGPDTMYGKHLHKCHLAIAVSLSELLAVGARLNGLGVATHNFFNEETIEPSVIGWMPSAQLYFPDPDGHALEYITVLDDPPDANFIGSFSSWKQRSGRTARSTS